MKVNYVVVDSGPIIKGADLERFCEHAISVPGVIREIKDLKTRERIRNLPPYFFVVRSPCEEAIKHVISVSKKTGDAKVLSKVDIEVLALAYEMQYLKTPDQVEKMFEKIDFDSDIEFEKDEIDIKDDIFENNLSDSLDSIEITDSESEDVEEDNLNCVEIKECLEEIDEDIGLIEDNVPESTSFSNDNDGWITLENIDKVKSNELAFDINDEKEKISIDELSTIPLVGCLTTDFAMQNILLHMDIKIVSINGMVVREPRIFVSWCRSCFHKFKRTDIFFCLHCGNDNLGKIPAKIKENGEIELFFKKNFQPNLRNKIFSIPTPKGGKHRDGNSYIYCADQRLPMERTKKSKFAFDVEEGGNIPFIMNEVTTRSSVLGISNNQNLRPSRPKGNKKGGRRK